MTDGLIIAPHTHAAVYVWGTPAIERELADELSFPVPGAEHMRRRSKYSGWTGRISLYDRRTHLVYAGLVPRILRWAQIKQYPVDNRVPSTITAWTGFDTQALLEEYPVSFPVRDYQRTAITLGLAQQRLVILSPTGSGKSLVLYYLVRERMRHGPVLLIVPTVTLVRQMVEDWRGYGWTDVDQWVHQITAGVRKDTSCPVVVSTWQSIYKLPMDWFARYQTLLGDEAHTFRANSLRAIMDNLPDCRYRIGVTGTLDDAKSHRLMVEGVFGHPYRVANTAELQAQQHLTPIKVQGHVLSYAPTDRQCAGINHRTYDKEIKYIVQHPRRLAWVADFVTQIPGNVLVLYQFVETHGVPLYDAIVQRVGTARPVYFISGNVEADERERIRALLEAPQHVVLTFGEDQVRCAPEELVPLTTGTTKHAGAITIDDDVADDWILNRKDRGIPRQNSDG